MDCEQTRQNLVAWLDGELSDTERAQVQAHLVSCSECARELERLQALQAGLVDAIPAGMAQLRLPQDASDRIRARLRQQRERRGVADVDRLFGQLIRPRGWIRAAIPLLVAFFVLFAVLVGPLAVPAHAQETVVVVPSTLAPGTDAGLRVIVRDAATGDPLPDAEVTLHLQPQGEQAALLYAGRTGNGGTADVRFRVPDYGRDDLAADLIVNTASTLGKDEIKHRVTVKRRFQIYFGTDKPLYRPGQSVYLRALALEAFTHQPAARRDVVLAVEDPSGAQLYARTVRASEYGVVAADYVLAGDAVYGDYRLTATLGDTVSERTVSVGEWERPRFRVQVGLDRSYYAPGEIVVSTVSARSFDGDPLSDAQVMLRAFLRDPMDTSFPQPRMVASLQGRTGAQGTAELRFGLPAKLDAGQASLALEASVVDSAGHIEWAGRVVSIALDPFDVDVVAEGGRLRPGVENVLYVLSTTPDGAPAVAQLAIDLDGQRHELATDIYGLGELRVVPTASEVEARIEARDAQGREVNKVIPLSTDRGPAQMLVRLDRAAYEVGDAISIEVFASQGEVIYLDMVRQGQTLGTYVLALQQGRAEQVLDVAPDMVGTLEVHGYQVLGDGTLVRDTRLAVVDDPMPVRVALQAGKAVYAPGETARVSIDTALQDMPVQSVLGIAVVDESVFALEERIPGFAKLFFLLEASLLAQDLESRGAALIALLDPPDATAVRVAQNVAARAAWASLPTSELSLKRSGVQAGMTVWAQRLIWGLAVALLLLALAQWGVTIWSMRRVEVTRLLRWLGIVLLAFFLVAPVAAVVTGGLATLLDAAWDRVLLGALAAIWFVTLLVLVLLGWQRRTGGIQAVAWLTLAYGVLFALLVRTVGQAGDPGLYWRLIVVLAFLAMLGSLPMWCAGLAAEKRFGAASAVFVLAVVSVSVVTLIGTVWATHSPLTGTLGDPSLYAGPLGWLAACAQMERPTSAPEAVQATEVVKEATAAAEKEVEVPKEVEKEVQATATAAATPLLPQPTPTAAATPTVVATMPGATPTPMPQPGPTAQPTGQPTVPAVEMPGQPPPLLGQFRPETIYWAPQILTDEAGHLEIDVPLPDASTVWRLTAFASTRQGQLGTATLALVVKR